eukprot:8568555-Pyramimonas_sp.AAC.1
MAMMIMLIMMIMMTVRMMMINAHLEGKGRDEGKRTRGEKRARREEGKRTRSETRAEHPPDGDAPSQQAIGWAATANKRKQGKAKTETRDTNGGAEAD